METSLKDFRNEYRTRLLDFLWRQWSSLGVAGHARSEDPWAVDPEALLLLTCSVGRHDVRLFDEALDWMHANGGLINIMRLKRILKTEKFSGGSVLGAIAEVLANGGEAAKWRQVAGLESAGGRPAENLFLAEDGNPLPILGGPEPIFERHGWRRGPLQLRGYSMEFRPYDTATLTLQLRTLLGINVRCEIILFLLTHDSAHPSQIARQACFFQRAVQGTMAEMSRSGVIHVRSSNREKHYWLNRDQWIALLNRSQSQIPKWVTWPPYLSALEQILTKLEEPRLPHLDPLLQSSEVRQLMVEVRPVLERAGLDHLLSDPKNHLGESYLGVFIEDVRKLLP